MSKIVLFRHSMNTHKLLLGSLNVKSKVRGKPGHFPEFIFMAVLNCGEALSRNLEADLRSKQDIWKVGQPFQMCCTTTSEPHKVRRKSSVLRDRSGERTTNESSHWLICTRAFIPPPKKNWVILTRITNPIQNTQRVDIVRLSVCGTTRTAATPERDKDATL